MQTLTVPSVQLSPIGKFWQWLKAIALALIVFVPLLIINIPQAFFWLFTPISPRLASWSARFFAGSYWSYIVWMLENVPKMKVDIQYGRGALPPQESVIMLANHQSYVDPVILLVLAKRHKSIGDVRFFVKEQLKFVPGPGWGMYFLDCIFLKRNWQQDAKNMQSYFERYKKRIYPVWIHIFPEGTRRTPLKQAATLAYTKEKSQDPLHHVLYPRTKGFLATMEGMGSHLQAILDVTIIYPGGRIPTLWQVFLGEIKQIKVIVDRYPIQELPQTAEGRHQWLVDLYYRKDKLVRDKQASTLM